MNRYRELKESPDIVILARRRRDIPEDFFTPFYFSADFRQYSIDSVNEIRWSTIHGFKGLESRTVILVGIDKIDTEEMKALFYVGASRTTYRFIWICPADQSNTVLNRLISTQN
jgi:superfamily I DNA/RNA helicase